MQVITDINDPAIELYKDLKYTPPGHIKGNVFVAEGEKVVKKLLESKIDIVSLFAVDNFYKREAAIIESRGIPDFALYTADKKLMASIVGFRLHSGVMAIGIQPEDAGFDNLGEKIICLNGVVNSENVGAIIRNAAAFGINSIIYDNETSSPYLRRAVRVSMGTVFSCKISKSLNLSETLSVLKEKGYRAIAAELDERARDINQYKFPSRLAIVFGAEGEGISEHILSACDDIVCIPIEKSVPSINVAASSAVFLYALTAGTM